MSRALVLLVLLCGCAALRPPVVHEAELPRRYCGRYYWTNDERCPSTVRLTLTSVNTTFDGDLVVTGSNVYDGARGHFEMRVAGRVGARTRHVVLHEFEPSRPDSVVFGAFQGVLEPDLATLAALWTTAENGQLGVLVLHADGVAGVDCSSDVQPTQ
jgi:hypothetical protein